MTTDRKLLDRRSVLEATGAALGTAVAGAGAAAANRHVAYAIDDPTDVYDACDGAEIGSVPKDSTGTIYDSCTDSDGDDWYYVEWDSASPDGWVKGSSILILQ